MKKILLLTYNLLVCLVSLAQPAITTFAPTSGPIGSSVIITGTGFNTVANQNIVFFGATQAVVTAASVDSLTVIVPLGATYQYIYVTNLGVNLTAYSAKPFIVTFAGNILFDPKVNFTTNTNVTPWAVSIGDIDGDGKPDLATANYASHLVGVFCNTSTPGTISFGTKVDFSVGGVASVSIGDIDGDGKPDLVTANYVGNNVSVLRNTSIPGTVSFATKINFAAGTGPFTVSIGDIDGDGKPDLAMTNHNSNTISVFRNTSTLGSISFATKVDFTTGTNPWTLSIGDIDGNGKPDLVVTNNGSNTVSVFRNTSTLGTISFATKVDFTTGTNPLSVSLGDIDGDGKPDLAVTNNNNSSVSVFRNTSTSGTVNFAARVNFTTGSQPRTVSIGDVNGDGKPDLVVVNQNSSSMSVFRNTSTLGTISLAVQVDFNTGTFSQPLAASIGDLDGDGKSDVTVAGVNNGIAVFRQMTPAPSIASFSPSSGCANTASIIITGTNFLGATAVTIGGVNVLSFIVNSATQITATVGNSATGKIVVTTPGGAVMSSGNFTVNPLPTVSLGTDTTQCGGNVLLDAGNSGSTYLWSTMATTQTINAYSSNTYSVTVTNGSNCSNADTINVTINPTVSLGADIIQCQGSLTLDAGNTGSTYLWSTTDTTQTINVSSSAIYSVTVTNGDNCSNADIINVTIDSLPILTTTLNGTLLTANQNGASYQWIDCSNNTAILGATNQNYTATANGNYAVVVTLNTCSDTSLCENVTTVGIVETLDNNTLSIYPNPFSKQTTLVTTRPLNNANFTVYNSVGQEVKQIEKINSREIIFNKEELPSGIYFIRLTQDTKLIAVKKLVITD